MFSVLGFSFNNFLDYLYSVRNLTNILFAVVYLFLTSGFTITLHYCSGEINNVSLSRTLGDIDPCGCSHESSCKNSCCKDEVRTIKLTDSQKAEVKFVQNTIELIIAVFQADDVLSDGYQKPQIINTNFLSNSSPPSLYLSNCILLI